MIMILIEITHEVTLGFDGLFFGVVLAYINTFIKHLIDYFVANKRKWLFFIAALALLSTNFIFPREEFRIIQVINIAFNPICFGIIMIVIINYHNDIFLKLIRPFSVVGMYSYSIYIFHLHFIQIFNKFLTTGTSAYYVTYFIVSLTFGILISKFMEYPILKYRERFFPSRSKFLTRINENSRI